MAYWSQARMVETFFCLLLATIFLPSTTSVEIAATTGHRHYTLATRAPRMLALLIRTGGIYGVNPAYATSVVPFALSVRSLFDNNL